MLSIYIKIFDFEKEKKFVISLFLNFKIRIAGI